MPRSRRQLALARKASAPGASAPLGSRDDVARTLARYNTSPDGGPPRSSGTDLYYGPGFILELPTAHDDVPQALVHLNDEDLAWPVLMRLCKDNAWIMIDLESGRSFG